MHISRLKKMTLTSKGTGSGSGSKSGSGLKSEILFFRKREAENHRPGFPVWDRIFEIPGVVFHGARGWLSQCLFG